MQDFSMFCLMTGFFLNLSAIYNQYFPPEKYTWWNPGFRSKLAMRNMDTWREATKYSALPTFIVSCVFLFIGILVESVEGFPEIHMMYVWVLVYIGVGIIYFLTQRHLKRTFNDDGHRRV